MKFNLKNRPNCQILSMTGFATRVRETEEWFEGFEKELRNKLIPRQSVTAEGISECKSFCPYVMIREILGEDSS